MGTRDLVRWGDHRLRLGPWRRDVAIAYLAPLAGEVPPDPDTVARSVAMAGEQGYTEVVTSALAPPEQRPFLAAGFVVREELHLLAHDLGGLDDVVATGRSGDAAGLDLRRGRRGDRAVAVGIDGLAFDEFWRFDELGLVDAMAATPSSRFRMAERAARPVGYAVCGRAGQAGYVQRVAVRPDEQGGGIGRRLVLDGLHWLRRRDCARALVNTQLGNDAALALYGRLGFRLEPHRLAVLTATPT